MSHSPLQCLVQCPWSKHGWIKNEELSHLQAWDRGTLDILVGNDQQRRIVGWVSVITREGEMGTNSISLCLQVHEVPVGTGWETMDDSQAETLRVFGR